MVGLALVQMVVTCRTCEVRLCVSVDVNTTDATTGVTALLLPAQNTHTLHDSIRDP